MPQPGASLLAYRAAISLSNRTLARLADLIRAHRAERRSRWRRLGPGQQALLVLAHLRNGDTYARLAGGFAIGTTTAWRYVREAIDLVAALANDVHTAARKASRLAYAAGDGTLFPIDRLADDAPYSSGKHHRHGVNVPFLANPADRLVQAGLTGAGVRGFADWGIPGCGRHDPHAVQAPLAAPVHTSGPSTVLMLVSGRSGNAPLRP
ncbi:hypothetical protein Ppa06_57240 [Planomonospora parontospora subsp. parontospora]|uniref:Transposase Helix-turn-helix domain-containing protein n=2 Tax=Planomonospora parontospora TaxID=58119 RepID=A0AA37BMA6_9ACTN|nr:hypothetical protein GCM10010126_58060 [Planomonospora parontospora]GII11926.1 hypothetical protein Ppa06_57240 [Planomonospora parontospora subsp. parontospora]